MSLFKTFKHFQILVVATGLMVMTACATQSTDDQQMSWVGTWSTSQQLTEPHNNPPEPGLSGNTIRQIVHVSIGGEELQLSLSNAFGTEPIVISAAHIAASEGGSSIDPGTDQALSFSGESGITIQPGQRVITDPFSFSLNPLDNVAITLHIESINDDVTGHPGSRTTSYIVEGEHVSATEMLDAATTDHWYVIDAIDVMATETAAAVATLGDSITDGRGSGTNQQNRWPDELSKRFQQNEETTQVAVLNHGIGGNCVLRACLGPAALSRFERDVIDQPGIRWVIILEGINDIGAVQSMEQAEEVSSGLIDAYQQMIDQAHEHDILVYGATLLPFGESFYDRPSSEQARQTVNEWIRTSGAFDAVIDLETALEDPENPGQMLPTADTGDHLHPNETGHRMMAEAIDLELFTQ